jgi:hypothetical protein
MHFTTFLQWLHDTHFSTVIRDSNWAEPIVEILSPSTALFRSS